MIEQDTVKLLRECDAGVKMGVSSIDDVLGCVHAPELKSLLERCKKEHEELGEEIGKLLNRYQDEGKEPNPIAQKMSWLKTNVKLVMHESDNQYEAADEVSKDITKRLINLEEKLTVDMREYL